MNNELERIRNEYIKRDAAGDAANPYSYSNPAFLYHMQERERGVMRMLDLAEVELAVTDVLEIGCGTGHILQRFLDFGARSAMGVDLMAHRIGMGRAKHPAVPMLCGDAGDLPFRPAAFGLVTQFMCLSSVLDPGLRARIAAEMWRVLAPGGVVLSYDLRPSSTLRKSIHYLAQHLKAAGMQRTAVRPVTPTRPLGLGELQRLFPKGRAFTMSLSLDFNLASIARLSPLLAAALSSMPGLRTHWIAAIRKPEEGTRGAT